MGNLKYIGIGIGFAIAGIFLAGGGLGGMFYEQVIPVEQEPIIFTKNVESLLPIREDVGTIWKISDTEAMWFEESGNNSAGRSFTQGQFLSGILVDTYVWKFDSIETRGKVYDRVISLMIQEGGYADLNFNPHDATCLGGHYLGALVGETVQYVCGKGNILLSVSTFSIDFSTKEFTDQFTRIILDKINKI